jgi:hypothetical protein
MTSPEVEILREWWREKFDTVMAPAPLEMPPVNHQIPLKDPNKKFRENTPRCPAALQEALATKIDRYVKAGWWYPASMPATVHPQSRWIFAHSNRREKS